MRYEYFVSYTHDNGFGYAGVTLEQKNRRIQTAFRNCKKDNKRR